MRLLAQLPWQGTVLISSVLSAVIVGSFVAMWLVANELEDPFGMEPNDICMMDFHHEFCATLQGLLHAPWMVYDDWTVASGPWLDPHPPAPATAAAGPSKPGGLTREPSKWDALRTTVMPQAPNESASTPASPVQVALQQFGSAARRLRLQRILALRNSNHDDKGGREHSQFIKKMKNELFVIPAPAVSCYHRVAAAPVAGSATDSIDAVSQKA